MLMDEKIKPSIIGEIIDVIQKYDCTFKESNEILLNTIHTIENHRINFETSLSTKQEHICSNCGGKMIWDKITVIMTFPAKYPYRCEKCGYEDVFKY